MPIVQMSVDLPFLPNRAYSNYQPLNESCTKPNVNEANDLRPAPELSTSADLDPFATSLAGVRRTTRQFVDDEALPRTEEFEI